MTNVFHFTTSAIVIAAGATLIVEADSRSQRTHPRRVWCGLVCLCPGMGPSDRLMHACLRSGENK
jgi:hypothetical protein